MKKTFLAVLCVALALAGALGGCSFGRLESGSLVITLPEAAFAAPSRGADSRAPGDAYSAFRVALGLNGTLLPIGEDGGTYIEKTGDDRTVRIDGLDAVSGYELYASVGTVIEGEPGSESGFVVQKYGESGRFAVTAGVTNTVKITARLSPFEVIVSGENASAVYLDGVMYRLSGNTVSFDIPIDTAPAVRSPQILTLSDSWRARSLGVGIEFVTTGEDRSQLWINTDRGVVPVREVYPGMFSLFEDFTPEAYEMDVDRSGGVFITPLLASPEEKRLRLIFSQGKGRIGGALYEFKPDPPEGETTPSWKWFTLKDGMDPDSDLYVEGLEGMKDRLDQVTSYFVSDYDIHDRYSYFVPASTLLIPPFRLGSEIVGQYDQYYAENRENPDLAWIMDILGDNAISVEKAEDGAGAVIRSVSEADGRLYVGTDRGVYTCTVNPETGVITGVFSRIADTARHDVLKVRAIEAAGTVHAAALTAAGNLLVLRNTAAPMIYRFHSGLPDNPYDISWYLEDGIPRLLVTGEKRVVSGTF